MSGSAKPSSRQSSALTTPYICVCVPAPSATTCVWSFDVNHKSIVVRCRTSDNTAEQTTKRELAWTAQITERLNEPVTGIDENSEPIVELMPSATNSCEQIFGNIFKTARRFLLV
jgi:hypothetical protein